MVYKIQPTISLNDRGPAVTNLKAALLFILGNFKKELGLKNDDPLLASYLKDMKEAAFTATTKAAVQLFQTKIVKLQNADGIVSEATANKINELLKLTVDLPLEELFTVHGTVQSSEGFAVAGKTVRAYDKDLRTEEQLGECTTAADGMYAINYTAAAFTRAEKNRADLFIRVMDEQGVQLQESNIVFNAPAKALIDVVLVKQAYRGLPEFTRYVNELTPVLENQQVEIKGLTEDDIKFLGNETGISTQHLSLLAKAYVFGDNQNRLPEVYYGLLRQNLPVALKELLSVKQEELRKALLKSIEQNIVSNSLHSQIDFTLGLLHEVAKQLLTDTNNDAGYKGIGAVIARSQLNNQLKKKFISLYLQHDEASFTKAIADDAELNQEHVQDEIKFIFAAKNITGDDLNLLSILSSSKAGLNISKEIDIARLQKADWIELIKNAKSNIPAEITGSNQEERTANYAATLNNKVEKAYPTQVLAIRLEKATGSEQPFGESKNDIVTFISNNKGYDVRSTPVSELESENSALNFSNVSDKGLLVKNLKGINRLQKVTSSYDGIIQMKQNGIDSSLQIAQQPQQVFVNNYSGSFGSSDATIRVHQSATLLYRISLLMGAEFFPSLHIPVYAMHGSGREHPASRTSPATWRNIFGSIDGCDCEHCMSVYSPAAYFTDLLHFLQTKSLSSYNLLMRRRPDLKHILLNCSNTNTPLPYIDLVNEILELKASDHLTDEYFTSEPGAEEHKKEIQTNWMAEELSANPEHFNTDHRDILKGAIYPFSLPYDDALESTRIYLKHLGVELYELLEVFGAEATDAAAIELLGLSDLDARRVCRSGRWDDATLGFGYESTTVVRHYPDGDITRTWVEDITHVNIFLKKASLTYIELLQLLDCTYPNYLNEIRQADLVSDDPAFPFSCDPEKLLLQGLNEDGLRRIYKFITLSKRTGWSFYELDKCLNSIGATDINITVLRQLSTIKKLQAKLNMPFEELLMLWSDFDNEKTYKDYDADGQPAMRNLFKKLFLNKSVDSSVTSTTVLPEDFIVTQKDKLIAALGITENELDAIHLPEGSSFTLMQKLSILYRTILFCRINNLNYEDFYKINAVTVNENLLIYPGIESIRQGIDKIEFIRSAGFSPEEIKYILTWVTEMPVAYELSFDEVKIILQQLSDNLKQLKDGDAETLTNSKEYVARFLSEKLKIEKEIISKIITELTASADGTGQVIDDFIKLNNDDIDFNRSGFSIDDISNQFFSYQGLFKICFIVSRLKLKVNELEWLHNYGVSGDIALSNGILSPSIVNTYHFTFENFKNLIQLIQLRDSLPVSEVSLFDVLNITNAALPVKEEFKTRLSTLTGWKVTDIDVLTASWSGAVVPGEYKNGDVLHRLKRQFDLAKRNGVSISFCQQFAASATITNAAAESAKNIVKSKYDNKQWLKIAKPLSDQLRTKRRDALVSYLVDGYYAGKHWASIDELYEYLLIDIQMDACMITSRIKQAISSVQLFMDRVLMNLEPGVTYVDEHSVPSDEVAKQFADQWNKWRKVYRIWEVNRKIFLYPENWIEPELRDNKSPFFKELENQLLQNEITDETAEDVVRDYLEKLDAVARLEIMGMYHQKEDDTDILHVFGRTYAEPHIYYYRKLEYKEWTAWEKVDLDIQGDHLIPVVWNSRLYLFWPLFTEKAVAVKEDDNSLTIPVAGSGAIASPPSKYWEIKMAWSEYKGKKWLAKKVTNKNLIAPFGEGISPLNTFSFRSQISSLQSLEIYIFSNQYFQSDSDTVIENQMPLAFGKFIMASPNHVEFFLFKILPYEFELDGKIYIINNLGFNINISSRIETPTHIKYLNLNESRILGVPINETYSYMYLKSFREDLISHDVEDYIFYEFNTSRQILSGLPPFQLIKSSDYTDLQGRYHFFYQDKFNIFYIKQEIEDSGKYLFQTFYHPQSFILIKQLNSFGIKGIFEPSIQKVSVYEDLLHREHVVVSNSVNSNHPTNELAFNSNGAYSIYNWELFFHTPLLIATQLNKNQKFEEARKWFHYIFNPTVPASGDEGEERFWITKPFYELIKNNHVQTLEELMSSRSDELHEQVVKWESNPFQPHIIARMRLEAYMKKVMMKYIDNLIDWGDQLYRHDTIETINEATQLYVLAAKLLGDRPQKIPSRTDKAINPDRDYDGLDHLGLDYFSNALINIESHITPPSSGIESEGHPLTMFYFCLIPNEKILSYWDTVADRLFKIRHCMNIEGMVRMLPLFEPPIDPALLVRAAAAGLDLNTILGDVNISLPHYRFAVLLQKANELCNDVKSLGAALLSAVEKRDAEELSRIRSAQELNMLGEITVMKEKQVEEANENIGSLEKSKKVIEEREYYYSNLSFTNKWETTGLILTGTALGLETAANILELGAGVAHLLPSIDYGVAGWGATPILKSKIGGENLGRSAEAHASALHSIASNLNMSASMASTLGSYWRRKDEWDFQKKIAEKELDQIGKQIAAADIRLAMAEKDLENHLKQIENAGKIDEYMRGKFSNQELYEWMKGQIASTYFQSYQLAYDTAKKAEKCFQHELGLEKTNYIQFGNWDSLKKGLLSGEKLQFDLRRLENVYLEENKREYEIVKHVSLVMLDPLALIKLRSTGSCEFEIPEVLYDMDHPGHYFRRLKSVSISLPCIAGPYTSISAKLSLSTNRYRKSNAVSGGYDETAGTDERFIYNTGSIQSIATSNAQNDSGVFELNFRDERYLPFEGTGAISNWQLELPSAIRQFDYNTISDVIIHVKYTAREGGDELKGRVNGSLTASLNAIHHQLGEDGLHIAINMKHDLSNEWHQLKTTGSATLKIDKSRLPYMTNSLVTSIENVMLVAKVKDNPASFEIHAIINDDDTGIMLQQIPEWGLCNGIMSGIALEQPFSLVVSEDQLNNLEELLLIIKFSV